MANNQRQKVFVSYSHQDKEWLNRLQVHLKPLERSGLIDQWDDTRILAGGKWKEEIEKALEQAKVAVLLVSADFLSSDFVADEELPKLLEANMKNGLAVLPVLVSPSRFTSTPSLSQFQAVNDPQKPLIALERADQEMVWVDLSVTIEELLSRTLTTPSNEISIDARINIPNTCFFIGGLGQKTDFQTGRTLDLNSSYEIIKLAVEQAGLQCIRADELQQGNVRPLIDYLIKAAVVIVDISTYDPSSIYELGLCHALRPKGTIVVTEQQFRPFYPNYMQTYQYEHMGKDLGFQESVRFQQVLKNAIEKVLNRDYESTSPLYLKAPSLMPPTLP